MAVVMSEVLSVVLLAALVVPLSAAECPTSCECSSWLGTYVACRGTALTEAPRNTFLPELEALYFTYNKGMAAVRGGALSDAGYDNVRVLVLNNNAISSLDADAFRGLNNVKQLDLSANEITTIPQEVFPAMKRLSRLNLFGNKQLVLPEEGWVLPRLTLLILRGCSLDAIPLNFFQHMPNLKNIKLDRNKFTHINADVFRPVLGSLQILDLSINKFTRLPRELLEVIPTSVELHIEYNRFNCDCEFQQTYCLYELREKRPRLPCKTPKKMRGVDGSQVRNLLSCGGDSEASYTCVAK